MTEQERNDVIEAVRARLTDDQTGNMLMIQAESRRYEQEDPQMAKALLELAMSLLSEEQEAYLKETMYIGERRLDQVYGEAAGLMQKRENAKALTLTRQLYEHILVHFRETAERRFFSFRNLLESNLYHQLYHPTKELMKTPFDFTRFIGAHAYNLVELSRTEEAIPVLETAIRYNPVNPDPRFELAEVYKLLGNREKLRETVLETHPICTTRYALGRCYANMAFYCTEITEYEDAVAFYYVSLLFADHPAIPGELQHLSHLMGRRIMPPTREQARAVLEKYHMIEGPGREVLYTATELSNQAIEAKQWKEATYYMQVISDLTNDPKAAETLKMCAAELRKMFPDAPISTS